jgi:hypothetical protein
MNINEIILTVVIAGFAFNFALMYIIWQNLTTRLDKSEARIADIEKRLIVIETMLHMKDCCLLKNDNLNRKAE